MWELLVREIMSTSNALRKRLGVSETEFRWTSPQAGRAKEVYFYHVLDEVQKAGCSALHWKDFLAGDPPKPPEDDAAAHLNRVIVEEVIDAQHLRQRKLTETLVELILFQQTDTDLYYLDYLMICHLRDYVDSQEDREEFYGKPNRGADHTIEYFFNAVRSVEGKGIDRRKRWYLQKPEPANSRWKTRSPRLSSFRSRYMDAIKICTDSELVGIGKSYTSAYGRSRDMHFTAHDNSDDFREEDMILGVTRCLLMSLAILRRSTVMLGFEKEEEFQGAMKIAGSDATSAELVRDIKNQKVVVGDYVSANGYFARVTDVVLSSHRFYSYEVEFLEKSPVSGVAKDWYAAFEVRPLPKVQAVRQKLADFVKRLAQEGRRVPPDKIQESMDKGALEIYRALKIARVARWKPLSTAAAPLPMASASEPSSGTPPTL